MSSSSLRVRWTVAMLAVALAPLALIAIFVLRLQRAGLATVENDLELAVADQAGREISLALDDAERAIHRTSVILGSARIADEEARLDLARDAIASCELVDGVSVFDREGVFIGGVEKVGVGAGGVLRKALGAPPKSIDRPRWIVSSDAEPFAISFVEPILADGVTTGFLMADARLARLDAITTELSIARFGRPDRVVVVDGAGLRVVAGEKTAFARGTNARSVVFERIGFADAANRVRAFARPLDLRAAWKSASSGEAMIGTVRTLPAQSWAVLVERPEEEAFRTLGATQRAFAIGAIGLALLAMFAGTAIARRTTQPIAELVTLTKHYARRELDSKSPVTTKTTGAGNEVGMLGDALENMATELSASDAEMRRRVRVEANLSRYLPEEVAREIANGKDASALDGRRAPVSVIFADIASFTPFVEKAKPEDVVALLNELFALLSDIVFRHGGMVDKLMGDCVMALFGVRDESKADHVKSALRAAEDMQRFVEAAAPEWKERYKMDVRLGIGVGTGEAIVGNLGTDRRLEFTAIGDAINVAARLETMARPAQILTTAEVAEVVGSQFELRSLGTHTLRGKSAPVEVFEVVV